MQQKNKVDVEYEYAHVKHPIKADQKKKQKKHALQI